MINKGCDSRPFLSRPTSRPGTDRLRSELCEREKGSVDAHLEPETCRCQRLISFGRFPSKRNERVSDGTEMMPPNMLFFFPLYARKLGREIHALIFLRGKVLNGMVLLKRH